MNLSRQNLFDLKDFPFKEIFYKSNNVWEVVPNIKPYIEDKFKKKELKGNYKEKNVYIGKGTVIDSGAKILGPAVIGENCHIGHGAYLRENCVIGDRVKMGHAVEIKNSIILNNTTIAHLNYVGNSIVGGNTNIGGGAMLANWRFDKRNIRIKVQGKYIDTGLEKLGSIIGDGSSIGVNSVLNPGTILGKGCVVHPLVSVVGTHVDGSKIR